MTTLYYFSATGNCLSCAQRLAKELGDCRLIPVASTKNCSKIIEDSEAVGFVLPVYYGNMPYPMREMIAKMVFKEDAYLFLVSTYGGHAGDIAKRMDQLLKTRGQKLSLSLGIGMPGNSRLHDMEKEQEQLKLQQENILKMVEPIRSRQVEDYSETAVLPATPVNYPNNFRGITADENCIGCGTCVKVCPMNNIKLVEGKAVIGDDCATCLACFHWCPKEAIWMSKAEEIARRRKYHHPDVTLEQILQEKTAK